jgi:hypothetical protein
VFPFTSLAVTVMLKGTPDPTVLFCSDVVTTKWSVRSALYVPMIAAQGPPAALVSEPSAW